MAEIPLAGLLDLRLPPSSFPKLTPLSLRRSFSLSRFSAASASTSTSSRATSSLELAASKGSYSTRYFDPVPSVSSQCTVEPGFRDRLCLFLFPFRFWMFYLRFFLSSCCFLED
ncbi:hypothetical protein FCM35_KLT08043 [Carex littledalei]|uniref:Uncharacterized protein n=1 Tax=Carex littledalei TaxID=544730 RepID=A0A833VK60_9POAL|nr:hypothetical protein FCM35_KLT08043 [Carex littledalei]